MVPSWAGVVSGGTEGVSWGGGGGVRRGLCGWGAGLVWFYCYCCLFVVVVVGVVVVVVEDGVEVVGDGERWVGWGVGFVLCCCLCFCRNFCSS